MTRKNEGKSRRRKEKEGKKVWTKKKKANKRNTIGRKRESKLEGAN